MNRRTRTRTRQKQINILHTTTRKRHSQKQVVQIGGVVQPRPGDDRRRGRGSSFRHGVRAEIMSFTPTRAIALSKIEIEPRDHFSEGQIRQAAGLEPGQNLWTLNLRQITRDLEKLPYVSSAKVERHFPDTVTISITERVPVVKIVGMNIDLNTKETFYLDRDGVVLKPREDDRRRRCPRSSA